MLLFKSDADRQPEVEENTPGRYIKHITEPLLAHLTNSKIVGTANSVDKTEDKIKGGEQRWKNK